MKAALSTFLGVLLFCLLVFTNAGTDPYDSGDYQADAKEEQAIKKVIETAYIDGIHRRKNIDMAKRGFHPDFKMLVLREGRFVEVGLDRWFSMIGGSSDNFEDRSITHKFIFVDVSGTAAVAKLDVYKEGKHYATDYMSLYKFNNGWKIVSKVFEFGE